MKIYGSVSELVSAIFRKNSQAITLRPNQATTYTASRDIQTPPQDTDSILVSQDATQTLTNKTLTSPVINTPTGITKSDVGLSNVDNTSDATKNSATVTLTNKTLTAPVINSPTGITKSDVGLSNVDNTSDATKNSATVVLTNKDIDGGTASNTDRITLPKASGATLAGLTRKQATLVYDTTSNLVNFDNGTVLAALAAAVDASPTQSGQVNTARQSFAGVKVFRGGAASVSAMGITGNVTLTDADNRFQEFIPGASITITMPSANIKAGETWTFVNAGNDPVQWKASDASTLDYASMVGNGSVTSARMENHGVVVLQALIDTPVTNTDWLVVSVTEDGDWTGSFTGWITSSSGLKYKRQNGLVTVSGLIGSATLAINSSNGGTISLPYSGLSLAAQNICGAITITPDDNSKGPLLACTACQGNGGSTLTINIYNGNATPLGGNLLDNVTFTAVVDINAGGY